jgi:hypothetical protein
MLHHHPHRAGGLLLILVLWLLSGAVTLYIGSFVLLVADELLLQGAVSQRLPDNFVDQAPLIYWPLIQVSEAVGLLP